MLFNFIITNLQKVSGFSVAFPKTEFLCQLVYFSDEIATFVVLSRILSN